MYNLFTSDYCYRFEKALKITYQEVLKRFLTFQVFYSINSNTITFQTPVKLMINQNFDSENTKKFLYTVFVRFL